MLCVTVPCRTTCLILSGSLSQWEWRKPVEKHFCFALPRLIPDCV